MQEKSETSVIDKVLRIVLEVGPLSVSAIRAHVRDAVPDRDTAADVSLVERRDLQVGWAIHHLVLAGLLRAVQRGTYAATDVAPAWVAQFEDGFSLDDLRQRGPSPKTRGSANQDLKDAAALDDVLTSGDAPLFSWIPFFEELGSKLVAYRDRQGDLIAFLESLRAQDLVVTPLTDTYADGHQGPMNELDPFTFVGTIHRGIAFDQRVAIARAMKEYFNLAAAVPSDFQGVPRQNNMTSWFIRFSNERGPEDVSLLWRVFEKAMQPEPWSDPTFDDALDAAFELPWVRRKLAMGLYWLRPRRFVSLDQPMRQALEMSMSTTHITAAEYRKVMDLLVSRGTNPVLLSLDAWLASQHPVQASDAPAGSPDTSANETGIGYWLVGAFWSSDVGYESQVERFVRDGIWENGYEDKYLSEVRSIKPGDKIAIKSAFTQRNGLPFDNRGKTVSVMRIHATGTVTANLGDGRRIEVEWDPEFSSREWYFFTSLRTIWRLRTDPEYRYLSHTRRLIDFLWSGGAQDLEWYTNEYYGPLNKPDDSAGPGDDIDVTTRKPYGVEDMVADGVFLPEQELEELLELIRSKKAVILQGPPGVGKTFLAWRLAYGVLNDRDEARVATVQFHQSSSYEDFIRGYRPSPTGQGFVLQDGVFLSFCERARQDPDRPYVFIIDEINRGNLSQIFGELLMLIETDKRQKRYGVPLTYRNEGEANFYVPGNIHLLGLMNVADRSLAMVDYALRRRFAFVDLEPQFAGAGFHRWLTQGSMRPHLIRTVVERMGRLNEAIAGDRLLGHHYCLGHSFFCPRGDDFSQLDRTWYDRVVRTEIAPLLREYWFDDPDKARQAVESLLEP